MSAKGRKRTWIFIRGQVALEPSQVAWSSQRMTLFAVILALGFVAVLAVMSAWAARTMSADLRLREGMVFTIEPMLNQGRRTVETLDDGWTVVTTDGKLSAQFEHTVAVTRDGVRVLTLRPDETRLAA